MLPTLAQPTVRVEKLDYFGSSRRARADGRRDGTLRIKVIDSTKLLFGRLWHS